MGKLIVHGKQDVVERKEAFPATWKNQTVLEAFFEAIPDATVIVSDTGNILWVNRQTEGMFGYTSGELNEQPVEILVPESWREQHQIEREKYSSNPQLRAMGGGSILFGRRKDGAEFPVDIMLSSLQVDGVRTVIAVIRDISARTQAAQLAEAEMIEIQHKLIDCHEIERQRLAQILHDGPLQELHSLDFGLVTLVRQLQGEHVDGQLVQIRTALQQISRQLRELCQDLRPPALTPFGLSAVLRSYAEKFQQTYPSLHIELDLADDAQYIPESVRLALYRICQQALDNVAQHAQAHSVLLQLQLEPGEVILRVKDDGQGFAIPQRWLELGQAGRYGLITCIERAESIRGHLEVLSKPGEGVTIQVTAPLSLTHGGEIPKGRYE
jgi:PAS domain S-box-containing protein